MLSTCCALQVYVALSRAREMSGLQVLGLERKRIKVNAAARAFYQRRAWRQPLGRSSQCSKSVSDCSFAMPPCPPRLSLPISALQGRRAPAACPHDALSDMGRHASCLF